MRSFDAASGERGLGMQDGACWNPSGTEEHSRARKAGCGRQWWSVHLCLQGRPPDALGSAPGTLQTLESSFPPNGMLPFQVQRPKKKVTFSEQCQQDGCATARLRAIPGSRRPWARAASSLPARSRGRTPTCWDWPGPVGNGQDRKPQTGYWSWSRPSPGCGLKTSQEGVRDRGILAPPQPHQTPEGPSQLTQPSHSNLQIPLPSAQTFAGRPPPQTRISPSSGPPGAFFSSRRPFVAPAGLLGPHFFRHLRVMDTTRVVTTPRKRRGTHQNQAGGVILS